MDNTKIVILSSLVVAGFAFLYWENSKNKKLLNSILFSINELRASRNNQPQPIMRQPIPKVIAQPHTQNTHPIEEVNKNEINTLKSEILEFESQIEELNNIIDTDTESDSDEEDIEELKQQVENNIEETTYSQTDNLDSESNNINNEQLENNSIEDIAEESDNEQSMDEDNNSAEESDNEQLMDEDNNSAEESDNEQLMDEDNNSAEESDNDDIEIKLLEHYYNKYTAKELSQMCRENNLTVKGNKNQLITRLFENKVLSQSSSISAVKSM